MNKVTRADVDVQPYAFTTKALFVGHMDHRYLRWQVVDTPGILDRPLEERNTIEMQAITALAHLQCCVLYFLDISEQCGYPLEQQLTLFESIRPLFANKQVMMVANKTDVVPYESLSAAARARIEEVAARANAELIPMSNISEENVSKLKTTACDKLLEARVDSKLSAGKIRSDVLARITVATPKPRDSLTREVCIPDSVLQKGTEMDTGKPARVTEKQLMWANGGPGVYACDYRKYYDLQDDDWKFDTIPEFMDGKNVVDFFDADIEERLNALEEEEAQLEADNAYELDNDDEELDEQELLLYKAIKEKQAITRQQSRLATPQIPQSQRIKHRTEEELRDQLENVGLPSEGVLNHIRGRKRERSVDKEEMMDVDTSADGGARSTSAKKLRAPSNTRDASTNKSRARSATKGPRESSVAPHQQKQVSKNKRVLERHMFKFAKRGEADREHYPKLVKHLNSGKMSLGTSTIGR